QVGRKPPAPGGQGLTPWGRARGAARPGGPSILDGPVDPGGWGRMPRCLRGPEGRGIVPQPPGRRHRSFAVGRVTSGVPRHAAGAGIRPRARAARPGGAGRGYRGSGSGSMTPTAFAMCQPRNGFRLPRSPTRVPCLLRATDSELVSEARAASATPVLGPSLVAPTGRSWLVLVAGATIIAALLDPALAVPTLRALIADRPPGTSVITVAKNVTLPRPAGMIGLPAPSRATGAPSVSTTVTLTRYVPETGNV